MTTPQSSPDSSPKPFREPEGMTTIELSHFSCEDMMHDKVVGEIKPNVRRKCINGLKYCGVIAAITIISFGCATLLFLTLECGSSPWSTCLSKYEDYYFGNDESQLQYTEQVYQIPKYKDVDDIELAITRCRFKKQSDDCCQFVTQSIQGYESYCTSRIQPANISALLFENRQLSVEYNFKSVSSSDSKSRRVDESVKKYQYNMNANHIRKRREMNDDFQRNSGDILRDARRYGKFTPPEHNNELGEFSTDTMDSTYETETLSFTNETESTEATSITTSATLHSEEAIVAETEGTADDTMTSLPLTQRRADSAEESAEGDDKADVSSSHISDATRITDILRNARRFEKFTPPEHNNELGEFFTETMDSTYKTETLSSTNETESTEPTVITTSHKSSETDINAFSTDHTSATTFSSESTDSDVPSSTLHSEEAIVTEREGTADDTLTSTSLSLTQRRADSAEESSEGDDKADVSSSHISDATRIADINHETTFSTDISEENTSTTFTAIEFEDDPDTTTTEFSVTIGDISENSATHHDKTSEEDISVENTPTAFTTIKFEDDPHTTTTEFSVTNGDISENSATPHDETSEEDISEENTPTAFTTIKFEDDPHTTITEYSVTIGDISINSATLHEETSEKAISEENKSSTSTTIKFEEDPDTTTEFSATIGIISENSATLHEETSEEDISEKNTLTTFTTIEFAEDPHTTTTEFSATIGIISENSATLHEETSEKEFTSDASTGEFSTSTGTSSTSHSTYSTNKLNGDDTTTEIGTTAADAVFSTETTDSENSKISTELQSEIGSSTHWTEIDNDTTFTSTISTVKSEESQTEEDLENSSPDVNTLNLSEFNDDKMLQDILSTVKYSTIVITEVMTIGDDPENDYSDSLEMLREANPKEFHNHSKSVEKHIIQNVDDGRKIVSTNGFHFDDNKANPFSNEKNNNENESILSTLTTTEHSISTTRFDEMSTTFQTSSISENSDQTYTASSTSTITDITFTANYPTEIKDTEIDSRQLHHISESEESQDNLNENISDSKENDESSTAVKETTAFSHHVSTLDVSVNEVEINPEQNIEMLPEIDNLSVNMNNSEPMSENTRTKNFIGSQSGNSFLQSSGMLSNDNSQVNQQQLQNPSYSNSPTLCYSNPSNSATFPISYSQMGQDLIGLQYINKYPFASQMTRSLIYPPMYNTPNQQMQQMIASFYPIQSSALPATGPIQVSDQKGQYYICNPIQNPANQLASMQGVEIRTNEEEDRGDKFVETSTQNNNVTDAEPRSSETMCTPGEKMCFDGSSCVPRENWCDDIVQCADASDELQCGCVDRIDETKRCDGYFDCPNGEDELGCFGCALNSFSCDDWTRRNKIASCVPLNLRCDGVVDCSSGKDEDECSLLSTTIENDKAFKMSNSFGYLHRNYKGKWYPTCAFPNQWAEDACQREIGISSLSPKIEMVPIMNEYRGRYLNAQDSEISLVRSCSHGWAVHVTCPPIVCGTRSLPKPNPFREEEVDTSAEELRENFLINSRIRRQFTHDSKDSSVLVNSLNAEKLSEVDESQAKAKRIMSGIVSKNISNSILGESRVVGGKPSQPGSWPWVVAIYRNGAFHCGGVLFSDHWILTAAHCTDRYWLHYYEVQAGILRRFSYSPMEQNRKVISVITHENFDRHQLKNDLAMMRLETPFMFNRWVRPICLPQGMSDGPKPGEICVAVGWGAMQEQGPDPDHLREVRVPVLRRCKHKEDEEGEEICAGFEEGGKDACQGDSGGPFMCNNQFDHSQWYVAGIVSHGEGCARPNEPGVYTRVSLYLPWINRHARDDHFPQRAPRTKCPGIECRGNKKCISTKKVCNHVVDCLEGEDELDCKERKPFEAIFQHYSIVPVFRESENNTKLILINETLNYNKSNNKLIATLFKGVQERGPGENLTENFDVITNVRDLMDRKHVESGQLDSKFTKPNLHMSSSSEFHSSSVTEILSTFSEPWPMEETAQSTATNMQESSTGQSLMKITNARRKGIDSMDSPEVDVISTSSEESTEKDVLIDVSESTEKNTTDFLISNTDTLNLSTTESDIPREETVTTDFTEGTKIEFTNDNEFPTKKTHIEMHTEKLHQKQNDRPVEHFNNKSTIHRNHSHTNFTSKSFNLINETSIDSGKKFTEVFPTVSTRKQDPSSSNSAESIPGDEVPDSNIHLNTEDTFDFTISGDTSITSNSFTNSFEDTIATSKSNSEITNSTTIVEIERSNFSSSTFVSFPSTYESSLSTETTFTTENIFSDTRNTKFLTSSDVSTTNNSEETSAPNIRPNGDIHPANKSSSFNETKRKVFEFTTHNISTAETTQITSDFTSDENSATDNTEEFSALSTSAVPTTERTQETNEVAEDKISTTELTQESSDGTTGIHEHEKDPIGLTTHEISTSEGTQETSKFTSDEILTTENTREISEFNSNQASTSESTQRTDEVSAEEISTTKSLQESFGNTAEVHVHEKEPTELTSYEVSTTADMQDTSKFTTGEFSTIENTEESAEISTVTISTTEDTQETSEFTSGKASTTENTRETFESITGTHEHEKDPVELTTHEISTSEGTQETSKITSDGILTTENTREISEFSTNEVSTSESTQRTDEVTAEEISTTKSLQESFGNTAGVHVHEKEPTELTSHEVSTTAGTQDTSKFTADEFSTIENTEESVEISTETTSTTKDTQETSTASTTENTRETSESTTGTHGHEKELTDLTEVSTTEKTEETSKYTTDKISTNEITEETSQSADTDDTKFFEKQATSEFTIDKDEIATTESTQEIDQQSNAIYYEEKNNNVTVVFVESDTTSIHEIYSITTTEESVESEENEIEDEHFGTKKFTKEKQPIINKTWTENSSLNKISYDLTKTTILPLPLPTQKEKNVYHDVLKELVVNTKNTIMNHLKIFPVHRNTTNNYKYVSVKSDNTPKFRCKRILESINISKRCDQKVDCQDATDEEGCSCADTLRNKDPEAICDGVTDCFDLSDELNCFSCNDHQFKCRLSKTCISKSLVCNGYYDCPNREDERDCFALTNGQIMLLDSNLRPKLNYKGIISKNFEGSWFPICKNNWKDDELHRITRNICSYLGFGDLESLIRVPTYYREQTISIDVVHDETARSAPINGSVCETYYIRCHNDTFSVKNTYDISSDEFYLWPWIAQIYVDGEYNCMAMLLANEWVVASQKCIPEEFSFRKSKISVLLGAGKRHILVPGPFEQIRSAVKIVPFPKRDTILVRLSSPVTYTRYVRPINLYRKKDFLEKETCVATGSDEHNITRSVFLKPLSNCTSADGLSCFSRFPDKATDNNCSATDAGRPWIGVIACETGGDWYVTSIFEEKLGACGFQSIVSYESLSNIKFKIGKLIEEGNFDKPEPSFRWASCDGLRCDLGKCIEANKVCDGVPDCRDASDERPEDCRQRQRDCQHSTDCACVKAEMRCSNGRCVHKSSFCDGKNDCGDWSDEPPRCTCSAFLKLVAPEKICDGIRNCFDRSDEDPKTCNNCTQDRYICEKSSHCVPKEMVCDGFPDCPSKEDEALCTKLQTMSNESCCYIDSKRFRSNIGEVMIRTSGIWHSGCFPETVSSQQLIEICTTIGFKAIKPRRKYYDSKAALYPKKDFFTAIRLHNKRRAGTVFFRPGDKAFVNLNETLPACHRLFLECV